MTIPDFSTDNTSDQWKRFCELLWFNEPLGIWVDISRMFFKSNELEDLNNRFQSALEAMSSIESGEIANVDENRQVGHYWLRNPLLAPELDYQHSIQTEISAIKDFGDNVINGKIVSSSGARFTDVLWIGIGGSGLGPLLIIKSLKKLNKGLNFHFIDNVDPVGIHEKLNELQAKLSTVLIVVVSKSGGTPEPQIAMDQARYQLESCGSIWSKHAVAITMNGSKLNEIAISESWLKSFDLPDWVGGRTSITSAVGLLPIALIGADVDKFLIGAAIMDEATRNSNYLNNPSYLLASSWFLSGSGKGKRDMVVLPYRDRLELFSRYLQQLVMESLGKKLDRKGNIIHQGLSVFGNKGSTDQHAYVQQLRDGIDNFFVTFIEVLDDGDNNQIINKKNPGDYLSGFLQGTRSALSEGGRQSVCITLRSLNEQSLGALIALFERTVGIYGELVNINAYHQPGVEAGKVAASIVLESQAKIEDILSDGKSRSLQQISEEMSEDNSELTYFILRHICHNNRNYLVSGDWGNPDCLEFKHS